MNIGFFGLGAMGYPMAAYLARKSFAIAPQDLDAGTVERFCAEFGRADFEPRAAELVVTCVTDESAIESLLLGPGGLLRSARPRQLFIDHTTTSPEFSRRAARMAGGKNAKFVDAPMSGGVAGARKGTLSFFVGGEPSAVQLASPVLACYGARITPLGPPGAGQTGKLANQIAIAGIVRGLQEASALARATGLDLNALYDALGAGTARSDQLDQHRDRLADATRGFGDNFNWLAKDLDLALGEARLHGIELPASALIRSTLAR